MVICDRKIERRREREKHAKGKLKMINFALPLPLAC